VQQQQWRARATNNNSRALCVKECLSANHNPNPNKSVWHSVRVLFQQTPTTPKETRKTNKKQARVTSAVGALRSSNKGSNSHINALNFQFEKPTWNPVTF
jgi:hypothetical protein